MQCVEACSQTTIYNIEPWDTRGSSAAACFVRGIEQEAPHFRFTECREHVTAIERIGTHECRES